MLFFPNAKINLGLHIINKRKDGFHNIETIFYPVNLCDIAEFLPDKKIPSGNIVIKDNLQLNHHTDNLLFKAYRIISENYKLPGIKTMLFKNIPVGAGLGGGSSDAAFLIKELNNYFKLKITNSELKDLCKRIGSDCPFFIENKPLFAYDKGDSFSDIDLSLKGYYILIVYPNLEIKTSEAYSMVKINKHNECLKELIKSDLKDWKEKISNDFEEPIFEKYPVLKSIKLRLYDIGATYASMSGSGSAIYGIFESKPYVPPTLTNFFIWIDSL